MARRLGFAWFAGTPNATYAPGVQDGETAAEKAMETADFAEKPDSAGEPEIAVIESAPAELPSADR